MDWLCNEYLHRVDAMVTVCDGIANKYYDEYDVSSQVMTNASDYVQLSPSPVNPKNIKIIHHGGADPGRKLEKLIEMMHYLDDRFTLYLMLTSMPSPAYLAQLKEQASRTQGIYFIDPVKVDDIVKTLNRYDIGIHLIEGTDTNKKHALPNKFFEYVQARLCVVVGPSPEMAKLVDKHSLGIVTKTFDPKEVADCINELTAKEVEIFKHSSNMHARQLSSEPNIHLFNNIVSQLIK